MTPITILPEKTSGFRALTRDKEAAGRTVGEALDALTSQLEDQENGTLVIIQRHRADEFFTEAQQARLLNLMQRRESEDLSVQEVNELERLVETELDGARQRAARLNELKQ